MQFEYLVLVKYHLKVFHDQKLKKYELKVKILLLLDLLKDHKHYHNQVVVVENYKLR